MIAPLPLMMPWATIDPMHARFAMLCEKNGLKIVSPNIIMPKFEVEPFTEDEIRQMAHRAFWYKKANIKKLRSIIRKAKTK
jgi:hypothetical protein